MEKAGERMMRGISMAMVALLALGVVACGQTKPQAAADLAANQASYAPKPAEPGAVFVGEAPPPPLIDYVVPVDPDAAQAAGEAAVAAVGSGDAVEAVATPADVTPADATPVSGQPAQ
jgi:hypothetical protein